MPRPPLLPSVADLGQRYKGEYSTSFWADECIYALASLRILINRLLWAIGPAVAETHTFIVPS